MAKVIAVHGIAQQRKGAHVLHGSWLAALRDGLARAQTTLRDSEDLACAFYGDLFRPKGKASDPPLGPQDVTDPWEIALLEAWWQAARETDPRIPGPDARTKARTPNFVQRALNGLAHLPFFKGVAEPLMIFDLRQVRLYMNDDGIRAAIQARVADVVGGDTRIMIGHSLGSIVAYEALCSHPEWPIRTFVTLGSPLGIRNLIFEHVRPPPRDGLGAWPIGLHRWTNVADRGDVVALAKFLGPLFAPGPDGAVIQDVLIHNGATAHDIEPYLTARETGLAIAAGL